MWHRSSVCTCAVGLSMLPENASPDTHFYWVWLWKSRVLFSLERWIGGPPRGGAISGKEILESSDWDDRSRIAVGKNWSS